MTFLLVLRPILDFLDLAAIQALSATCKAVRTVLANLDREGYWLARQRFLICNSERTFASQFQKYLAGVEPIYDGSLKQIVINDESESVLRVGGPAFCSSHTFTISFDPKTIPKCDKLQQFSIDARVDRCSSENIVLPSVLNGTRCLGVCANASLSLWSNGFVLMRPHRVMYSTQPRSKVFAPIDNLPFVAVESVFTAYFIRYFALRSDGSLFELFFNGNGSDKNMEHGLHCMKTVACFSAHGNKLGIVHRNGMHSRLFLFESDNIQTFCNDTSLFSSISDSVLLRSNGSVQYQGNYPRAVHYDPDDPFVRICADGLHFVAISRRSRAFFGRFYMEPGNQLKRISGICDAIDCRLIYSYSQNQQHRVLFAILDRDRNVSVFLVDKNAIVFLAKISQDD
jgi:hypothetical protein